MELIDLDIKNKMKNNIIIKVDNQVIGIVPVLNILESYNTKMNDTECTTCIRFDKPRISKAFDRSFI